MIQVRIVPRGWKCALGECPPGLFYYNGSIALKTEYGAVEAYLVESGEAFVGGIPDADERAGLLVQPCVLEFVEFED